jgi:hypothetical protein
MNPDCFFLLEGPKTTNGTARRAPGGVQPNGQTRADLLDFLRLLLLLLHPFELLLRLLPRCLSVHNSVVSHAMPYERDRPLHRH